jgi:hypothetical protein
LRRGVTGVAAGLGAALISALLLDSTGYDFLFYENRLLMKRLAWAALVVPLVSVPFAIRFGWHELAVTAAERIARRWMAAPPGNRAVCAAGVAVAGVAVSSIVLLHFPNSADEYAYIFQAETYAQARIYVDPHPLQRSVHFMHDKVIDGKWVSRFPPGWPFFMAPFSALGLPPWAVNPLVAAACVALLYGFARREYGPRTALVAALLFGVSGFLLLNAGSYYSHPFGALLSLAFVAAACRYLERPSLGAALAAGVAIGWLGFARHMNAVLLFPPFVIALMWRSTPSHWLRLWPMALSAGAFLTALLAYNQLITGDPFVLPTTLDDPRQAIGFVGDHTPARAYKWIQVRLLLLPRYTSGLFLFLYVMALGRAALRGELRWWDSYFVLALLGYSLYRNSAHETYGPRYLFEAFPFVALRIAWACAPAGEARAWRPLTTWLVGVHLAAAVASLVGVSMMHGAIVRERRDPVRIVEEADLRDAVVFVASGSSPTRPMPRFDLVRNTTRVDDQSVVWAHLHPKQLDAVTEYYPGRSFWVYTRARDEVRGRLVTLDAWRAEQRVEADPGA